MEFGFLNEQTTYSSKYFNIEPLPDIQTRVQKINAAFYIENGWLYPPYERNGDGVPAKPWVWYDIFSSHTIKIKPIIKSFPKEFPLFSVLFFGFLKGMQLAPAGHGKFYKTPFEIGKLTGFIVFDEDICKIMDMAAEFYLKYYKRGISKRYYAAMFWFLYGQSYTHSFEKFDAQYRVVDSIFKIYVKLFCISKSKENEINHAGRIPFLCDAFKIPTPVWGKKVGKSSIVSRLRNNLVHNAIFEGEPIGYRLPKENYGFDFPRLNEKLLLSIIGVWPKVFSEQLSRNLYRVKLRDSECK